MLERHESVEKCPARPQVWASKLAILFLGMAIGAAATIMLPAALAPRPVRAQQPARPQRNLPAELDAARAALPDQAHAMLDVASHFTDLWFCGETQNWALAKFYLGETRSHLQWSVRIRPTRKDASGRDIDLAMQVQAFNAGQLKALEAAIAAGDRAAFERAYAAAMQGCYECHKACGMPYLRLQIPERCQTQIIDFDPQDNP